MKRFILLFAFILSASTIQAQTTNIQATITDPHSIPYSFGTGSVSLVCPGNAAPTYNGYTVNRNYVITGLDGNGFFTLQLHDLGFLDQSSCNYRFAITWKDGVTSFIAPGITGVTGVGPVDLSAAISAFSVLLPTSGGGIGGVVNAGQEVYGLSPGVVASSPNFIWNQSSLIATLLGTTPATSGANQPSPSMNFVDNYWNGSASAACTITLQSVPGSGTNAGTLWTFTSSGCGSGGAAIDFSALQAIRTSALTIVNGAVVNTFSNQVSAGNGIALPPSNGPNTNSFVHTNCGNPCAWSYQNAPWSAFPVEQTGLTNTYSATLSPVLYDGATQYWITWDAKVTTPATTGAATSTLGPLTLGWTDPDGVTQSVTAAAQSKTGTIETSDTGNSTTTVLLGIPILMNSNNGSNTITISMGYSSNTANQMAYNFHLRAMAVR
jgi:hypothetical protein